MPPRFTEAERERITAQLCEAGRREFARQGLRKTSLDELVRPAGIAKSSFYAFFESKEELYVELMYQQVPELSARLIALLDDETADPAETMRRFLRAVIDIQQHNPLYHRLVTHPEDLAAVTRKLSPERLEQAKDAMIGPILEFLARLRRERKVLDVEPRVLLGVIQAVLTVPMHQDLFDPDVYQPTIELLVDLTAAGLTRPPP